MMNKNERNQKMKNIAKKGLTLSLCAVLAGGIAAAGFGSINAPVSVEAAANEDVELIRTGNSGKDDNNSDAKEARARGGLDVSDIAEDVMPSVVSITMKSIQEVESYYGMFGGFGGYQYAPQEREVEGSGSGIIIGKNDEELLIATNYHVVQNANTLSVSFIDGEVYKASVKGFDEEKDLAVVSVELKDIDDDTMDAIEIATIGSSDDLKVGEQVVAIGNALGYGQSVTTGIVSAKNRRLDDGAQSVKDNDGRGVNLIQTDAAINPGNSGGALLNMDGEVVGINSAKLASTEVEGMGYAIAISDVADIIENLMNEIPREKVENHGVLGIQGGTVSDEAIYLYDIPAGVLIREVTKGMAAEDAGLKAKMIITKIGGKTVSTIEQLQEYLTYYEAGEEVEITVQIPHGESYKEKVYNVVLSENYNNNSEENEITDGETKKNNKNKDKGDAKLKRNGGDEEGAGDAEENAEENSDDEFFNDGKTEDDESNSFLDFFKMN